MTGRFEDQISGSVERITYYNEENGYTVLRLKPDSRNMLPFKYASGKDSLITVIGNLPELNTGEWLKLTGKWATHSKHGRQFQAENCEQSMPASLEGVRRYLGSGLIKGIGPVMADRIVDAFGEETLDVIEYDAGRLNKVPGIGKKRIDMIMDAWEQQKAIKDVMIFLQSHQVSTRLATKIYKKYEGEALNIVQNTPYRLVQDIHGIGFKTADKIAQALGLAHDDPGRIEAGIAYTLNRAAEDGHVYVPQDELEPKAAEILELKPEQVTQVISQLETDDLVKRETLTYDFPSDTSETIKEEEAVYLTPFYYSEVGVTNRVRKLNEHPTSRLADMAGTNVGQQSSLFAQQLTPTQKQGVQTALQNKVSVLTGGPGTGKTTTLRTLLDILDAHNHSYALASPTGRAAKRLGEATGRTAKTIHRLLEFKPGEGWGRNEHNPLDVDMVIIDEASMLDLVLTNTLLKAINLDTHLLLVGDVDQLPSVGAGDVLRDLIASNTLPVTILGTIFRQAANSLIIQNAHRINQGEYPLTDKTADDFFIFIKDDAEEAAKLLVDIVHKRLPHRFGLDPFDDIQVLAPMYNGAVGVNNLNQLLQGTLNPGRRNRPERRLNGRTFRVGDKVMQTINNYDKNVYNGDIGRVTAIDQVNQTVTLNIDGNPVVYDFLEVDELVHAYAITVHKSQGSEYPCVVIPVMTTHYLMLQRNLIYTAITRAKRLVILVGTRRAIRIAIGNNKVSERHTALDYRLQQGNKR